MKGVMGSESACTRAAILASRIMKLVAARVLVEDEGARPDLQRLHDIRRLRGGSRGVPRSEVGRAAAEGQVVDEGRDVHGVKLPPILGADLDCVVSRDDELPSVSGDFVVHSQLHGGEEGGLSVEAAAHDDGDAVADTHAGHRTVLVGEVERDGEGGGDENGTTVSPGWAINGVSSAPEERGSIEPSATKESRRVVRAQLPAKAGLVPTARRRAHCVNVEDAARGRRGRSKAPWTRRCWQRRGPGWSGPCRQTAVKGQDGTGWRNDNGTWDRTFCPGAMIFTSLPCGEEARSGERSELQRATRRSCVRNGGSSAVEQWQNSQLVGSPPSPHLTRPATAPSLAALSAPADTQAKEKALRQ